MNLSKRQLYAAGEPLGECVTRIEAGRLVCGGGGGGAPEKSTTTQSIPEELKPLASKYAQDAIALSNTPYQAYRGDRFADLNMTQNLGIGQIQNRALYGDATVNAGRGYLQNQLNSGPQGATVNPYAAQGNPYLDQMVNKAQDSVRSQFNTGAVNSGSFGNSGLQEQFQEGLGDVATQMYGNAYNTQANLAESGASRNDAANQNYRSNNLNAAQLGLSYGNQAYTDAGQLLNAGQLQQDQQQQDADFGYQQFQDQQNDPYKKLAAMSGVFQSAPGQSSTTTNQGGGGK